MNPCLSAYGRQVSSDWVSGESQLSETQDFIQLIQGEMKYEVLFKIIYFVDYLSTKLLSIMITIIYFQIYHCHFIIQLGPECKFYSVYVE